MNEKEYALRGLAKTGPWRFAKEVLDEAVGKIEREALGCEDAVQAQRLLFRAQGARAAAEIFKRAIDGYTDVIGEPSE